MKIEELKTKSKDELKELCLNYKKELMNLRFQKTNGSLTNFGRIKFVRKMVAKIKTLLNNVSSQNMEKNNA